MPEPAARANIALPKKQHNVVAQTIARWRADGVIDETTAAKLGASISVSRFDWQRTARYAFIVSIACLVITANSVFADEALIKLIQRLFDLPALVKCAFFAIVAGGFFRYGLLSRARHSHRLYGNEAIFLVGVLALAASVFSLGVALDTGSGHYSLLFLIASALYALLGLWFPSGLVWIFGLLSLGAWMGTETGYASGQGMYFLGMNYPLRFVVFGAALSALGIAGQHAGAATRAGTGSTSFQERLLAMSPQTKVIGLLNLFISLWIMSIFGNYSDINAWNQVAQFELLHWVIIFSAVAIGAVWHGLRHDDGVLRGFGLTFLFIDLYTRYFEYFWNAMHKAAFFALLAGSFWLLGRKAETMWHLVQHKQQPSSDARPAPAGK